MAQGRCLLELMSRHATCLSDDVIRTCEHRFWYRQTQRGGALPVDDEFVTPPGVRSAHCCVVAGSGIA